MAAYFTAPRTCRYLKLPPQMVLACGTSKLSLAIPVSFKNFLWCFFSNNFFNPGRRIFTSGGLCRLFPSPLDIECYISWLLCWVLHTLPSPPPWPYWAGHVMADPTGIALLYPQGLLSCIHRKLSSTPCPDKPIATEQQPSLSGFTSKASCQPLLCPLEVPCFLSALIFTVMSQAPNFGVFQGQGTFFKLFEWLPAPLISFTWFRIWGLTFFSHRQQCRDSN